MRGISRASLAEASQRLAAVLAAPARSDGKGGTAMVIGDELFAVLHFLDREHALRRALSDPAKPGEEKAAVLDRLLRGKVLLATAELAAEAVRLRWSSPRDLADALERLAVSALVAAADARGKLDDVEDELFRLGRVIAAQPELRLALSNPLVPPRPKHNLLESLLTGRVTEVTLRLVTEVAEHPRGRSLERSLEEYAKLAAMRRNLLVATVRTATELSVAQRRRLANALAVAYGHEVHLNVMLDPGVVGGLSVQVGDEVIDGTVASRLDTVRRRLTG